MAFLAPALISGGASILGGLFGKNSANKAAQLQAQANQAAADKVEQAARDVNPMISTTALYAGNDVKAATDAAAAGVTDAAGKAAAGANAATEAANAKLDPYAAAGANAINTLNTGLAPGGDFNKVPTLADIQIDPGFAFRQQQAQLALDRSASVRGGNLSGAAIKSAAAYQQNLASQEYQNAFNRFETVTQNRYSNLLGVSDRGQAASGAQGQNLINTSKYAGDIGLQGEQLAGNYRVGGQEYASSANINAANLQGANTINAANAAGNFLVGKGQAQASGVVGGSNALVGGLTGAANGISGALTLQNVLRNPAVGPVSLGGYTTQPIGPLSAANKLKRPIGVAA